MYPEFAENFCKNLIITYNLRDESQSTRKRFDRHKLLRMSSSLNKDRYGTPADGSSMIQAHIFYGHVSLYEGCDPQIFESESSLETVLLDENLLIGNGGAVRIRFLDQTLTRLIEGNPVGPE
ncbi:unnamed protein product, partial [Nippostrongylus brasiliensis]|uniref:Putative voltage-gated potassium channel (inferred by orthology to a S. mansoni protein) n=1 Tax=Nippostrongylus brasiliensis TaxID=27835 RepID=A0A0N4XSG0_NIPBR